MGISALIASAFLGHASLLTLLLTAKANVNHADNVSHLSLDYASME
jgi:ankyrin repeat protein